MQDFQRRLRRRFPHRFLKPAVSNALTDPEPLLGPIEKLPLKGIHWMIAGGESGPRAREMKPEWARSIRDQCVNAGVPFFFKQWGGVQRKLAGRRLDRRE